MAGADDALQVRSQMPAGEVRRLAAFADQDQARRRDSSLGHGFDDIAVTQAGGDLRQRRPGQDRPRVFQDGAAVFGDQLGALASRSASSVSSVRARAQAGSRRKDRCRPPPSRRPSTCISSTAAPVRDDDPGSVVADAGRIDRAVDQCDDFLCHASSLNAPAACPSRPACRAWPACRRWFPMPRSCPMISTSAPSRRNFSTAMSSACTDEISQICAARDVDHHAVQRLFEIERRHEILDRGVEHLPLDPIGAHPAVSADRAGARRNSCAILPAKKMPDSSTPSSTPMARLCV